LSLVYQQPWITTLLSPRLHPTHSPVRRTRLCPAAVRQIAFRPHQLSPHPQHPRPTSAPTFACFFVLLPYSLSIRTHFFSIVRRAFCNHLLYSQSTSMPKSTSGRQDEQSAFGLRRLDVGCSCFKSSQLPRRFLSSDADADVFPSACRLPPFSSLGQLLLKISDQLPVFSSSSHKTKNSEAPERSLIEILAHLMMDRCDASACLERWMQRVWQAGEQFLCLSTSSVGEGM
jgi:hypothetical protein